MPKINADFLAWNRGLVSPLALARTDVDRTRLSAETMVNWTPKTQGAMRLRPGGKYLGSTYNDTGATLLPFVAATDDVALIELTHNRMRVRIDDTLIERPALATAFNGFNDTGAWQDKSTGAAKATFGDTGVAAGLTLNAQHIGGIAKATRKTVLNDTGAINLEHALRIYVDRGPVTFRCGNDTGDDTYIPETTLRTGYHSLAFTPTAAEFHITFESNVDVNRIVGSIALENDTGAATTMEVTTPWGAASLDDIRYDQSADVVFVACHDIRQMRIERRGAGRSWSVTRYLANEGPFFNTETSTAKMTLSGTFGNRTLTASKAFFKEGHVGAIFRLLHEGQGGTYQFSAVNGKSDVWKVQGIGSTTERRSSIVTTSINDTGLVTIEVQRSFVGPDEGFRTVQNIYTNTTTNIDDADDNITVYYRLLCSEYSDTGKAQAAVTYDQGSKDGLLRVTGYTSPTSVSVEVLSRFSATGSGKVESWAEGRWSDAQAFPSSVVLHEGRLWWFGGTQLYGSVSDDYENFNAGTVGDAGPINRTIAFGPVDRIHYAVSLLRLIIGTAGQELSVRSTSLDEPLTPTNMAVKSTSTQGSANLPAISIDDRAVFVQRTLKRVFMIAYDGTDADYRTQELTLLVPDLLSDVVAIAVQRQPDTRIHIVMGDGSVAITTYEAQEQVLCWSIYQSTAASGAVEKVCVLPGEGEDQVYYLVRRTINGATKRFLERQATEAESVGDTGENWMMDCAVSATRAHNGVITGLSHLEGEKVIVWANGVDLSPDDTGGNQRTYTVASGQIATDTGDVAMTAQVGLPYMTRTTDKEMDAQYKTTKLAYAAAAGTALTMPKRVDHLGVILGRTHNPGLFYGQSFDTGTMQPLPRVVDGRTLNDTGADANEVFDAREFTPFEFPGDWNTDSRLCLAAKAPRPCTLLAAVVGMQTHDKI